MEIMTPTTIIAGAFALACVLIGAVYNEPKAYDEILRPVLRWLSLACLLVGGGVFVGHYMVADLALSFVEQARTEEARRAMTASSYSAYWFQLAAILGFVLDIGLYVLAKKSAKWKAKE